MNRRGFIASLLGAPVVLPVSDASAQGSSLQRAVVVRAGEDRQGKRLLTTPFPLDEKVAPSEGEFAFEVGTEKFRLTAGDSIYAPRRIPHVWACVSEPGTMILLVQPAGSVDAFFRAQAKLQGRPTRQEAEKLFAAHGMTVVGDPLPML